MPTFTNHDMLGHVNRAGAPTGSFMTPEEEDNSCANSLLFPVTECRNGTSLIAQEHDYAVQQRFVSANSYYGYHPVMTADSSADCSMDTSEPNLSFDVVQNRHTVQNGTCSEENSGTASASRKRNMGHDLEEVERATKRTRRDDNQETTSTSGSTDWPSWDMPLPRMPSSTQVQSYDIPSNQSPVTSSHLAELAQRPRCLMGHFI